jgi:hypothetical protein
MNTLERNFVAAVQFIGLKRSQELLRMMSKKARAKPSGKKLAQRMQLLAGELLYSVVRRPLRS